MKPTETIATNTSLAELAQRFQDLTDSEFRDDDGLLTCIHASLRPLVADDLDEHAYNRPPYAGMGSSLLWWQYEMTNLFNGEYLVAMAQRARTGETQGILAGQRMLDMLLSIYFDRSRHVEVGMFGKPIVPPGGLHAYNHASELNHDQVIPIMSGLWDFHPFATPDQQSRLEQMVVEIADIHRKHGYYFETRGAMALGPGHSVHANKPMLFMLLADRFAPSAGFKDEYLRWFDMMRADPKVNATSMSWLHYTSIIGQARGDDEVYYQGVMNMYLDAISRMASLDPDRRSMLRTRLRQWWDEQIPLLRNDGKVQWSKMVTLATRHWRDVEPGEIERGPYSCWWGAPVIFSGQWFATMPVQMARWWPQRRDEMRQILLRVLHAVKEPNDLAWCWPQEGAENMIPANIRPGLFTLMPPIFWLHAYWEGRATGLLKETD